MFTGVGVLDSYMNVYANGALIASAINPTGGYDDNPPTGGPAPTYTIEACLVDGTPASPQSPGTLGPN